MRIPLHVYVCLAYTHCQQVLAAAIVVVFLAGLVKLWWLSRYLKKHTVLDLEKRARQMEMQKSGLPAGKRVDIPFGVRARSL